jgi:hypothetical protein
LSAICQWAFDHQQRAFAEIPFVVIVFAQQPVLRNRLPRAEAAIHDKIPSTETHQIERICSNSSASVRRRPEGSSAAATEAGGWFKETVCGVLSIAVAFVSSLASNSIRPFGRPLLSLSGDLRQESKPRTAGNGQKTVRKPHKRKELPERVNTWAVGNRNKGGSRPSFAPGCPQRQNRTAQTVRASAANEQRD